MTQNKRVSELLLKYTVLGQQQMLKTNTDVTLSFQDAEEAAKRYGTSIERLQELSNARIEASPLQGKSLESLKELERVQKAQIDGASEVLQTEQKITSELDKQGGLLARLTALRATQAQRLIGGSSPTDADLLGIRQRSVPGTLNTVRDALISAPGIGYQNPAVVALRGVSTLADKTGASFGQLGAAVGIAGVAAVGVGLIYARFAEQLKDSKRLLDAALAAQRNYFEALGELTSEEVDTRIQELQRVRPLLEQQARENRSAADRAFQDLQNLPGVGDLEARLLFSLPALSGLKTQAEEAEAALQENVQTETRLTQGRESGVFAANDLRQAEEELTEARKEALENQQRDFISALEDEKQMRLQLAQLRRSGNSEGIRSQLTANDDEIALLRNYLIPQTTIGAAAGSETANQQLKEYNDRLQDLYQENRLLLGQVLPIVAAREAETAALKAQLEVIQSSIQYHQELASQIRTSTVDQVSDRLQAIEEERRAIAEYLPELQRLAPTSQAAAQALAEAQDSLTSLSHEYNDQLTRVLPAAQARALTELNADLAQLEGESNGKLREIEDARLAKDVEALERRNEAYEASEEKRSEAVNKLADDQATKRLQIERKSNADLANSIYARDALAAYLTLQKRKEDLQTLKEDGEARQGELDRQFAKDRQTADRNYDKARQQAQQAADRAAQLERSRYQTEYNERVTAYNNQLTLLRNFVTRANTELANLRVPTLQSGLQSGVSGGTSAPPALPISSYGVPPMRPQVGDTWTDAFGQLRIWNGNGWQAASAVRGYATGTGFVPNDGLAYLHQGERVLTPQQNRVFGNQTPERLFGGQGRALTINIPIQGSRLTKSQIKDLVDETIDETLPPEWDESW